MLENLRKKSLVHSYQDDEHSILFANCHASFLNVFSINQHTIKLSTKSQTASFPHNTYELPYTNVFSIDETYENVGFSMIACPSGSFTMGHSKDRYNPPKQETIAQPFLLGETEVTQELYSIVMGSNPSHFQAANQELAFDNKEYSFSLQYPVERVSWVDTILFCNKLSELQNLEKCYTENPNSKDFGWDCDFGKNGYRLPTEKEWEYAAKAGTDNRWAGTDNPQKLGEYARFQDNSTFTTHSVKMKAPNEWGFYDMTGNVWEWCWDKRDVEDPEISAQRVTRGGGFSYDAPKSKSTYRGIGKPNVGLYIFGFRIARSIVN